MPRTPRNPGSGKAPVNTPARNEPATGDGWGGPPNGEGNRQAGPGRPEGVANGEGKRASFRAIMAPHVEATAERWLAIIGKPAHPHHHTMIIKHAELMGEMKQVVDMSVKTDPSQMTDAELAAIAARGRAASARQEEDQG